MRTDIMENITDKYIQLQKPFMCPKCNIKTTQLATKNIKKLKKKLEKNPNSPLDSYVLKLIK